MPRHETADVRARAGRVQATTITVDRPDTVVRGANGDLFTLPRRPADSGVVVYHKVNGRLVDPTTGQRVAGRGSRAAAAAARPRTLSFGAVALTAFLGFRVCQLLRRCFAKQPSAEEQQQLLLQQLEQQQQQAQLPPVRVSPGMLQRALPQLGPPRRVKRIAQHHRSRQRRIPNAQQKLQQRGVVQRRPTTLQKWDSAIKQQVHALVAHQQQRQQQPAGRGAEQAVDCSRSAAALPLPGLPGGGSALLPPPQPLLEVADAGAGAGAGTQLPTAPAPAAVGGTGTQLRQAVEEH